jgi:hypothetical protein
MATSPHVEEQRAIEAHKQEEAEANYAAFTNYSGTKDREIPTARRVDRAYSLDEYYDDNYAAFTNYSGTKDREIPNVQESTLDDYVAWKEQTDGMTYFHPNAAYVARDKFLKQHENDKEFEIRGAAEPSDEEERTDEERKYHAKIFQGARPARRNDSTTRSTSGEIKKRQREKSDGNAESNKTESRTKAKGESDSNRPHHAISSNRSAASRNETSSDSDDDRHEHSRISSTEYFRWLCLLAMYSDSGADKARKISARSRSSGSASAPRRLRMPSLFVRVVIKSRTVPFP